MNRRCKHALIKGNVVNGALVGEVVTADETIEVGNGGWLDYNHLVTSLYVATDSGTTPTLDIKYQSLFNGVWKDIGLAHAQVTTSDVHLQVAISRLVTGPVAWGDRIQVVIDVGADADEEWADVRLELFGLIV